MRGHRLVCPRCNWDSGKFWALCQVGNGARLLPELGVFGTLGLFASLRCPSCLCSFEVPANCVPPLIVE